MGKIPCCEKNGLKRGPWTPEEDKKLIDYIQKHGHGRWRTLPKNAGLKRCGKSCRLRWANYLRPDIKRGRFSFEEEEIIIQLHSVLGNKWSAIASRLPGRTDNEIKNYWNTHIRKRLLRMGIDPVTHTPRLDLLELSSAICSTLYSSSSPHNPQINVPNLLGIGPIMDPDLLNLATTFLSCQQNQIGFSQMNQTQFQSQLTQPNQIQNQVQEIQSRTTSNTLNVPVLSYPGSSNLAGQGFVPTSNQLGSYDSKYESMISHIPHQNYNQPCTSNNVNQYQNFQNMSSFGSVLSSTPSSSPATTLNSSPAITYINSSTEDERDSFCSNILMYHDIPNGLNATKLLYEKNIIN